MEKLKSLAKNPVFWAVTAVVVIGVIAYASKIPAFVKKVAGYLPGSDTKAAA